MNATNEMKKRIRRRRHVFAQVKKVHVTRQSDVCYRSVRHQLLALIPRRFCLSDVMLLSQLTTPKLQKWKRRK